MKSKPNLLIVNQFHPETIEQLKQDYSLHHLWQLDKRGKLDLVAQLSGECEAAATASWACDPLVYEIESLKLLSCFGVGVDGIDFTKAKAMGLRVTNTPEVLDEAVADLAMGFIISLTRNLVNADNYVRTKKWENHGPLIFGEGLQGKTLGILGLGRIGEAIAKRATPFGLNISYHNRKDKQNSYQYYQDPIALAKQSDLLVCVLPGTEATRYLVDKDLLKALGSNGYFINVGRGSTVAENALADALEDGTIAGAALDVYESEPKVNERLLKHENIILAPHIGSATLQTRRAMGNLVASNIEAFFDGAALPTEYQY